MISSVRLLKAVNIIKNAISDFRLSRIYVGHSGGKDSCVINHLTELAVESLDYRVVHTPKANGTHPDTLEFLYYQVCLKQKVDFVPFHEMEQYIRENYLKCQIDGTRRSEFDRGEKSTTVIVDGVDVSREDMSEKVDKGIFGLTLVYPIYDWTDEEVFQYLADNNLPISHEYYNVR